MHESRFAMGWYALQVVGAYSLDICTGLSGCAAVGGTLLPESAYWVGRSSSPARPVFSA